MASNLELRTESGRRFQRKVTPEQMKAIAWTMVNARELQRRYPQIADDYRRGLSHSGIVERYHLGEIFSLTSEDALPVIVRYALIGNDNPHLGVVFQGLIEHEEYIRIAKVHQSNTGWENSQESIALGRGIFGMTSKQLSERGKDGAKVLRESRRGIFGLTPEQRYEIGKRSGEACYKKGAGIHALSYEERSRIGRDAGEKSAKKQKERGTGFYGFTPEQRRRYAKEIVIARGQVPWGVEELVYALQLAEQEDYKYGRKIFGKKIAAEVNIQYHNGQNVRNAKSLLEALRRHRRSITG